MVKTSFRSSPIYPWFIFFFVSGCLLLRITSSEVLGYRLFTNISSSMMPYIREGGLTMTKRQSVYEPGDIIAFYRKSSGKETIISHRIIRTGGNVYLTKGDANAAVDETQVLPRLIIGKVILIIPLLGYLFAFIKSPLGFLLFIGLPTTLIFWEELNAIAQELKSS